MLTIIAIIIFSLLIIPIILALPVINIDVSGVIDSSFYSFIRAAAYFLPMGTISAILSIIFALFVFRILIAVVKAIRNFLP